MFASSGWLVASVHWVKNDRVVLFTKTSKVPRIQMLTGLERFLKENIGE